jgi:alpha-tubulin suppressor-like RCC1 family protein
VVLERGDTLRMSAAVQDLSGAPYTGIALRWASSDTTVAAVDQEGRVAARALGVANVWIANAVRGDTARVHVATPAAAVEVAPLRGTITTGSALQFSAVPRDSTGLAITHRQVQWTSADTTVATVNATGLVRGLRLGRATILAEAGAASAAAAVDVVRGTWRVVVSPDTLLFVVGATQQLTFRALDSSGSVLADSAFVWISSDPSVATVSTNGLLLGKRDGHADIVVLSDGLKDTAHVEVATLRPSAIAPSSTGPHTCALSEGRAFCWGSDDAGQLGNGPVVLSSTTPVGAAVGWVLTSVAAGTHHTCALGADGAVWCWGGGSSGQLGNGQNSYGPSGPVQVSGGVPFHSLAVAYRQGCALAADGAAWCWGDGNYGQLGNGSRIGSNVPIPVLGGLKFSSLAAGYTHVCGIAADSTAWCWGSYYQGQLGNNALPDPSTSPNTQSTPVPVYGGLRFRALAAGSSHTCGIAVDSLAYCWGGNWVTQLGASSGTQQCHYAACSLVPVAVRGARKYVVITAGWDHTCALTAQGQAYCWGGGARGQLGGGVSNDAAQPELVTGSPTFRLIAAGEYFTCGIASDGVGYCWGSNRKGQLGTGGTADANRPQKVAGQSP